MTKEELFKKCKGRLFKASSEKEYEKALNIIEELGIEISGREFCKFDLFDCIGFEYDYFYSCLDKYRNIQACELSEFLSWFDQSNNSQTKSLDHRFCEEKIIEHWNKRSDGANATTSHAELRYNERYDNLSRKIAKLREAYYTSDNCPSEAIASPEDCIDALIESVNNPTEPQQAKQVEWFSKETNRPQCVNKMEYQCAIPVFVCFEDNEVVEATFSNKLNCFCFKWPNESKTIKYWTYNRLPAPPLSEEKRVSERSEGTTEHNKQEEG